MQDIQISEAEWYLRDYFFRQGKNLDGQQKQFKIDSLAGEMISMYLRYRNSDLQQMNEILTVVIENLVSNKVIKRNEKNNSLELEDNFSRLQCSKCFYISYLNSNESRNCLRCSSSELHDFPKKK